MGNRLHYLTFTILIVLWGGLSTINTTAQIPPGVVVDHIPSAEQKFIGSPSLCILSNGDYLASHDEFGPKATQWTNAQTPIFKSTDKGKTWHKICQLSGQYWSKLFRIKDIVYIMGVHQEWGNVVIRKSTDGGMTWTTPSDSQTGILIQGNYQTHSTPFLIYKGKFWKGIEKANLANKDKPWPLLYEPIVMSIPLNKDFLKAENWTVSSPLSYEPFLDDKYGGWLEGNIILDKNGTPLNIVRVHADKSQKEVCGFIHISEDGKNLSFNRQQDLHPMPGSAKKFSIIYDKKSKSYWSIVSNIQNDYIGKVNPDQIRNSLALICSQDLITWTIHKQIIHHPDRIKHGFQYVDWDIEGKDIVFLCRTAYDEPHGQQADTYHNANYLTFHRIKNFRK